METFEKGTSIHTSFWRLVLEKPIKPNKVKFISTDTKVLIKAKRGTICNSFQLDTRSWFCQTGTVRPDWSHAWRLSDEVTDLEDLRQRSSNQNQKTNLSISSAYLLHLAALPLARRPADLDRDGALLALPAQRHAVGLQRAEGDLQLGPGEAAGSAILSGDLRGVEHRGAAGGTLRDVRRTRRRQVGGPEVPWRSDEEARLGVTT